MVSRIRNYVLIALAIGAFYYLLSHHFILYGWTTFDVLRKDHYTMQSSFVMLSQNSPQELIGNDLLRAAGIEDILIEKGLVSPEEIEKIKERLGVD
ncbi:MAG: hypothetical protein HKP58_03765 [Desulfatitalea sp.]|nr:hypothetical protein [Desulfatitalea sp.]NNJ99510.1 hypothetical protein [Desulfatitalea sp.]